MQDQDLAEALAFESTTGLMRELARPESIAEPLFHNRAGDTIKGKWRLDSLIGVGGTAAVYAATHRNGNRVAIKVLHPTHVWDERAVRRFQREGSIANLIQHDGVVRVLDEDQTEDGSAFFVMELLEGETLEARVKRHRRLSEQETIAIGMQLLDVLAAAHARGIVHRDIKPANIFLTQNGKLKVFDFGIARVEESANDELTRPGAVFGSPEYMAPEQARGRTREIDAKTDVFAVGATLFNMLTGTYVHGRGADRELFKRAANNHASSISSVRADVSSELAQIVDRALEFEKAERWPDASSMLEALRSLSQVAPQRLLKDSFALGKYELFATLAAGGMSDVFLGVATGAMGLKKLAVVKQLRPVLAAEKEHVNMFLDEARLAARLNHPNVVQTYEFGEESGAYFMAMEYLEGQSLSSILSHAVQDTTLLGTSAIVTIVAEALAGLHYAHELQEYDGQPLNVVHRDVSPHNLFVTYDGQVKVLDFGIARAAKRETQTASGVLKGKVTYMAPEQASGHAIDRRADLFAVGVILWEALCGRKLIVGESAQRKLERLRSGSFPRASEVVTGLDSGLDDIIAKSLESDPNSRFQTAQEMREALEDWLTRTGQRVSRDELGKKLSNTFSATRQELEQQIGLYLARPANDHDSLPRITPEPKPAPSTKSLSVEPKTSKRRVLLLATVLGSIVALCLFVSVTGSAPIPEVATPAAAATISAPPDSRLVATLSPAVDGSAQAAPVVLSASERPAQPLVAPVKNKRVIALPPSRQRTTTSAQTPEPPPVTSTEPGFLTFDTYPWTIVSENGRVLGTTPLIRVALPPGNHTLTLENPEQGLRKTHSLSITSGQVTTRRLGKAP